ncbi:hypothetical protein LTS18_011546 [Coniosporium uncinatum]|uniref:Uncharacterized protein n=1 Tax=Coniosporium uncinatum TaxID=93489 RepID=A0ACC3DJX6_9PEZI|nr:hypothetical protein LTS18_011546 [Coniosporium uncinatum]
MAPLTTHLLNLHPHPLTLATTHPFLTAAGRGTLPPSTLAVWLVQDEHYIHAYIPFIGHLLTKLTLPTSIPLGRKNASLHHRILDCLVGALSNVRREEAFFAETIRGYGIEARSEGPTEGTRKYLELFGEVGREGTLVEGMVVLWATELCYLRAWQFAGSETSDVQGGDGDVVRREFIPNWTSREFEQFVEELGGLVNECAEEVGQGGLKGCEAFWERVLEVEKGFWPEVKEGKEEEG